MKKRIFSMLLAIVMVVGLLPTAALAAEDPQCFCAAKCTDDNLNIWCDICGVLGAAACLGEDTAVPYAVDFPLHIVGVQVNSTNMDDITAAINKAHGEKVADGKASYDMFTGTLTLDGFIYMGEGDKIAESDLTAAITHSGIDGLNIHLKGANSIRSTDTKSIAIYSGDSENGISITADSDGSLELSGMYAPCSGNLNHLGEGLKMWDRNGQEIGDDGDYAADTYLYIAAESKGAAAATDLSIGGVTLTDAELCVDDGNDFDRGDGYAAYDPNSNTLTLKNYNLNYEGEKAIFYKGTKPLNIRLIGENSVTNTNTGEFSDGLFAMGSLNISGDGSLEVSSGYYGVCANGDININGGTVVTGITDDAEFSTPYALYTGNGDITISGGIVEAYGATSGIQAAGSIKITGGSVVAQGGGNGMDAGVDVTIDGGVVSASSVHETAVDAEGSITINGGVTYAGGQQRVFNKAPEIVSGWAAYDPMSDALIENPDWNNLNNVTVKQNIASTVPITVGDEAFVITGTDEAGNNTFNPIEGGNGTATLTVKDEFGQEPVYTLTLNNFTYSGPGTDGVAIFLYASYADRMTTFNLVLEGNSKITLMPDVFAEGYGLLTHYVDLTNVSGEGSLTLVVDGDIYEESKGVYIEGGDLIMQSGSLTVVAAEASFNEERPDVTGVSTGVYVDGDLTMNGGSITATGGEADVASYGVYVGGNITMGRDSELIATAGSADFSSYGVYTDGDLTMTSDSKLTATGGKSTDIGEDDYESFGVYVDGKVEMTGTGTSITATGGSVAGDYGYSRGLGVVNGDLTVSGGSITAIGGSVAGDYGYSRGLGIENGGLTVNVGGSIDATGGDATGETGKSIGVMVFDSLRVSGNGSVKGTGGDATSESYGVYVQASDVNTGGISDTITVNGGKLIGNGGSAEDMSAGVYLQVGNLTVTNGSVTGKGGDVGYMSVGVYLNGQYEAAMVGNLTVNGGSVTGTGGKATGTVTRPGSSAGIVAVGGSVTNGSVIGTGGEARDTYEAADKSDVVGLQSNSIGIMVADNVNVSSGSVTGTGGSVTGTETHPGMSAGIAALGGANITGGTTVAQGETSAFMALGDTPAVNVDPTFTDAAVWYGESADAANAETGTPAGEIAGTVYNNKYVRIAESGSEPPVSVAAEYPVWVGGVQFTIDKLTIPGDKGTATLTVGMTDPENPTYTLKLNGYEFVGAGHKGAVIYSEVPLTIELNGDNRVISYGSTLYGVYFEDDLTVTGDIDDTLTAIGSTAAFNKIPNIDLALAVYDEQENYVGNSDWAALKYARIAERIKVDYTVETYTMDTNGDYGTPETETLNAAVDSAVSVAPEAKIGFTVDTAKSILSGTVAADGSTVLKVYYSRDQYDIHYETNGGTINGTYPTTYTYGVGAELPDAVTREGYTFKGWYSQPTGDTDNIGSIGTRAAGDKYYYAYWEINEYTITFDTDGGSEVAPITLDYNTPVTAPADPTKTGYTFAGWSPEIPAAMPAEDITVTAQWTVNQYPVTFNAGEGTFANGSKEITINVDFGTVPTAPETPTLTGYAFAGWEPALAPVTVNGAAYTATYAPGSVNYTVEIYTMDTTGAYGDPVIETKTAETADFVFATTEAKEGFTVDTDASVLEGVVAADGSTVLKVFYRRIQYNLKTVVDSVENVETYYYGETITPPASPEKTGYTFAGWEPELPETMPANDVTVTAQWTVIQYTITFDPDNGEEPTTITQNYGTAITAPTTPTKNGCHFLRWDTEVPATMPRENLTITAVWEAHTPGYTASGDTITEACTGCPIVVTGKATISAAGKTYDGTAVTASVAYSTNWMGGDLAITYAVKDGETLPEAPKNAGTYTASITIGGATASVEFTIEQKELTPAISGSVSKPYDGTTTVPDGLSITLNGKIGDDDVTAAASYAYAGVNVGTTKINATGITLIGETAKNYTLSSATASADVGKIIKAAVPTMNIPVQQHIHTIATTDNTVNIAEKLPDDRGETSYTVSAAGDFFKDGMTVSEDGVLTYGTNAADGKAAGTITVAVTMANYESVNVVVPVELTAKAVAEIALPDGQNGVYDGQAQIGYTGQPDAAGYEGTLNVIYTGRNGTEYNSEDAPVNAGDYTVTFSVPDADLYYTGSASLDFTVAKADLTITAENKTVYRNTELPELTYTAEGLVGDDVLNTEPTIRCDADISVIGSYPITVSGADAGANYSISYQEGTLTVYETTYTVTFVWNGAQGGEAAQTVAKDAKVAAPSIPEYDGYRFMGWFADEALTEEWDMDSDTVTGDMSLYAKWLKKEDVSVGGNETVTPDVVVDDTTVIIKPTEEEINQIVENSKNDESIVIDLSVLDDTVHEVQIPQKLISEIVDSMDDPETETEYLEIITPAGTINLDKDVLESLSEHEEADTDCDLVLGFARTELHELTEAQLDVLKELNVCGSYDIYAECTVDGSIYLTETGAAEIKVPFTIPDGCSADEFTVWCVSEDGELEKLTAWYEDGCMNWSVNDFSDFVIVYEEKADDDSEKDDFFQDQWMMSLMLLFNQKFDITATAAEGGTITPYGVSKVKYDKDITYTITPDEGYEISAVLVDGKDIGAVSEYTFQRVKKDHTITAVFEEIKWQNPFTDVNKADWFYEDVQFVSETGLMIGTNTAGTQFSPDTALTRAMLVTVLWRLEGEPVVNYLMPFTDIADGEWYTEAVRWAAAEGIVNGYEDSTFRHTREITREQVMAILHRYAAYKGLESGMIFPMIPQYNYSLWAENDIIWADMVGLTDGIGADIYDMTTYANRAEIAAYLRRFCEAFMEE